MAGLDLAGALEDAVQEHEVLRRELRAPGIVALQASTIAGVTSSMWDPPKAGGAAAVIAAVAR